MSCLKIGDWVLVNYDNTPYPGEIVDKKENFLIVSTMEKLETCYQGKRMWRWPRNKDILQYPVQDLRRKIDPPSPTGNRASQFIFNEEF